MSKEAVWSRLRKPLVIAAAILILLLYYAALIQKPWADSSIRSPKATVGHTESHWTLSQGDQVLSQSVELPLFMHLTPGETYTLTTRLTYDGSQDQIPYGFLYANHLFCRIYYDGAQVFSFYPGDFQKWDHSKSPGHIYKALPLPKDCLGKELTIEFSPSLTVPIEYGLPEMAFGDLISSADSSVVRGMPHNIITVLCFLLGAMAIIFSALTLKGAEYREGFSIGIFALLFSLYALTECVANFFFIGNPYYTYLLNYTAFSLLPVSLMGFIRERMHGVRRKICSGVIWGELIFFVVEMILHMSGILDMREILPLLHVIYFSQMGLIFLLLLTEEREKREYTMILQLTPIMVGMIIDGMIYWFHLGIGINDATVTMVGVMLFLITEVVHVWRASIDIYAEYARSKLYRQMAYVDELTGAHNRRAFDEEIQKITEGEKNYDSLIVASLDINDLKWVNDHCGHHAGDHLIQTAARILLETMGNRGKLFRTGGDEFVAFLYDTPLEVYESMVTQVMDKALVFDAENPFRLIMAVGYVQIFDHSILDAVKKADQMMYADKERRKRAKALAALSQA